jgi:nicotinate-nucleotide pyrophosphorylase
MNFPTADETKELIQLAQREDLGNGDVTSRLLDRRIRRSASGRSMQKEVGIACGLPLVEMICRAYDERLRVEQIPGFHMETHRGAVQRRAQHAAAA